MITSWTALLAYVRVALAEEPREQFRALFLDKRNRLLRDELVAHGTIDHAPVYPREVVRRALEVSAAAIILVHNHPSGDPEPSRADIEMTRKIVEAAKVFEIQVLALSDQRGPASVAQTLYAESEASKVRRAETLATLRAGRAGYQPPETKPDKRARRLIRALGDIDAT